MGATERPWIGRAVQYDARHPYSKRWERIESRIDKTEEDWRALEVKLNKSVQAVRTVEKLVEQWPEAKAYVPSDVDTQPPPPMVPGAMLTAEIKRAQQEAA